MKFCVSQKIFLRGIQTVQRVVSKKNTLPILSGILIKAEDNNRLKFAATDLEIAIECYVKANIFEKGEIVLPADHLSAFIRELPLTNIEVVCNLQKRSAEIICGRARFNINGFSADDFPILPMVNQGTRVILQQPVLKEMIEQVKIALSHDETNPFFNGALFKVFKDEVILVASDDCRIVVRKLKIEKANKSQQSVEVILPNKTLNEVVRLLEDETENTVIIENSRNLVRFQTEDIVIVSRLIEGKFPSYERIIPKDFTTFIKVDRKELFQALKRVSLVAESNSGIIKISLDKEKMILDSRRLEIGQTYEELPIEMRGSELEIAFKASYLLEYLKVANCDKVEVCFRGGIRPFLIRPVNDSDYTYVIGPTR